MIEVSTIRDHASRQAVACLLVKSMLLLVLLSGGNVKAQDADTSQLGIEPGVPAGSHPLSSFDNINFFSGNLNFTLPFLTAKGRGSAQIPLSLSIEHHWKIKEFVDHFDNSIFYPDTDWGVEFRPVYGPGLLIARSGVDGVWMACPYGAGNGNYSQVLTRLAFTAPDGTEYQLRDKLTGGQPHSYGQCWFTGNSRGTEFVTADGTAATFVSDAPIYDLTSGGEDLPSGYLMLRDGTRYRINQGFIEWMRDRNGNRLTFTYDQSRLAKVTDSLNREITIAYNVSEGAPYGICDRVTYKGFDAAPRTVRISRTPMSNVLRAGSSIQTYAQLFPDLNGSGSTQFNPTKVSALWLPDGIRSYTFYYNSYGELARVVLPTGGAIEYDWSAGLVGGPASGTVELAYGKVVYRRVVERRLYSNGIALTNRMTTSRPESASGSTVGYVDSNTLDGSGNARSRNRHYFYGSGYEALGISGTSYSTWQYGKEYKTEVLDSNGITVLRRVENTWQQRALVSWWTAAADLAPPNDPRVTESKTTIEPGAANLVTKQTFAYDDSVPFNNQNNVKEYAFGTGVPGALLRETRTTFLTTAGYTGTNVHLRSLPTQVSVYDSGGIEQARATYEYDNYTATANHAALTNRLSISGLDSAFTASYTTRGNTTGTTSYLLTNGSVTGSTSAYAQYDIAGNVVKAIDARGYATTFNFADRFGVPDAEARLNAQPLELSSQGKVSFAFPSLITNASNHTVFSQRDYYTGQIVDAEDVNGVTSSGYYNDELDRPTQVIRAADDTDLRSQTSFSYDDTNRIITTTSDLDNFDDLTPLKSQTLYDGLGRNVETRQYETATTYVATKQTYDALGRSSQTSNPYRSGQTVVWTTMAYDALGRVTSVKTPDNAIVTTSYSGNTVTVTDQAGKDRQSTTDAVGQLTQVIEDPGTGGLGYVTTYAYDVLGNLKTVTQGVQTRTFTYDSLSRLKTAVNPESGTVSYTYDNNSNLLTKTDARSIITTFSYDALNRATLKNYSDTTPDVAYFYDAQTLPTGAPTFVRGSSTGRLVAVTTGGTSAGSYSGFDGLGQTVRRIQRTDSVNYLVDATYNKSGAMLTEIYPSVPGASDRRTVSYTHDLAGRLASLSSLATTYAPAASITSVSYAAHGALASQTLGNNLMHAQVYNNRLQPTQIKLGTAALPTTIMNLTYNYGTTTNNGNLVSTTYAGGGLSYTQTFGYDALNRLTTSQEGASWSQTNSYDRYGNRAIVGAALTFSASNNRITNAGYIYDAVGNLTNDSTQSFTYDAENKITKVNNVPAYVYDGEGQRVRKLVGENLRFVYDIGGKQIAEFDGATGALKKEYIYGASGLVATIEPTAVNANGTRYTTSDHLGSPRVVTNSAAGVASRHDYMPFGEELGAGIGGRTTGMGFSVADGLRQKFTSKERDVETGLDYFNARYYASIQGRFTSPDLPFMDQWELDPQSWNLYAYVRNNPLRSVDPTGNAAEDLCDEICQDSKKRAEEERKKAEEEGIDVVVIDMEPPAVIEVILVFEPPPGSAAWVTARIQEHEYEFEPAVGGGLRFSQKAGGSILRRFMGKLFPRPGFVNTTELVPTHGLTKSRRAFQALKDDISEKGVQDSIKYVVHNGEKYVVDGHHRLRAARQLGISEVPAEQVSLPYKGYKTIEDLFF